VVMEEVRVTASRTGQSLGELPAQATVLEKAQLGSAPAQTADEVLRQVPGFSLFRRPSSAVAHPTTQGISLRGMGASGASRALVLIDGMPLNDPFEAGWRGAGCGCPA
jgi:outer membrane receptor for ferrienterochelin and colicin